jgi:hypothetical protein
MKKCHPTESFRNKEEKFEQRVAFLAIATAIAGIIIGYLAACIHYSV